MERLQETWRDLSKAKKVKVLKNIGIGFILGLFLIIVIVSRLDIIITPGMIIPLFK